MEAAEVLIRRASSNRACESTAMNSESSRSHVVFMLYIHGMHPPSGTDLQGCLCLVDLAGRWVVRVAWLGCGCRAQKPGNRLSVEPQCNRLGLNAAG
eukprot:1159973-Pelagomonas_calceolata.AAC.16